MNSLSIRHLCIPFFITITMGIVAICFRPLFPIDETRYVSVAWEMWHRHDFLVPFLNGEPYHHKPPLFFWLIHTSWWAFGVNDVTPRVIPLLFSLVDLMLVCRISRRLWPENKRIALFAAIVLSSTLLWAAFDALVMFDVILTSWVLIAVESMLALSKTETSRWVWGLVGLAVGCGILTKGPVIFVYVLPVFLFIPFRYGRKTDLKKGGWFLGLFIALVSGVALALIWAVPAAQRGGDEFRDAIFWGQTAKRMVSSFAHERPFWWYLPIVPIVLCPWPLWRPLWKGGGIRPPDEGVRFCLTWFFTVVAIFSFISGKQVHYLLPILPAFALFAARRMARVEAKWTPGDNRGVALFFVLAGLALIALPHFNLGSDIGDVSDSTGRLTWAALIAIASGLFLMKFQPNTIGTAVKAVALCMLVFFCVLHWAAGGIMARYDLSRVSEHLHTFQQHNLPIVHYGKYHGQFNFLGRLKEPIPVIRKRGALKRWIAENPDGIVISTIKAKHGQPDPQDVFYSQPYKNKILVVWRKGAYQKYLTDD